MIRPSRAAAVFRIALASADSSVVVDFIFGAVTTPVISLRHSIFPGATGNARTISRNASNEEFGDRPDGPIFTDKLQRNN